MSIIKPEVKKIKVNLPKKEAEIPLPTKPEATPDLSPPEVPKTAAPAITNAAMPGGINKPTMSRPDEATSDKVQEAMIAAGVIKAPVAATIVEEDDDGTKEYQTYNSSRNSTQMISTKGRKIRFTNFLFITKEQDIIDYLDMEIAAGCRDITKGVKVSTAERDPMALLKAKHIEEYKVQLAKAAADKALGVTKDMGTTEGASKLNPLATTKMAR